MPPTPVDELVPAILASAEKMLAAGITSVCDAMVGRASCSSCRGLGTGDSPCG